jgi:hypothetical protein
LTGWKNHSSLSALAFRGFVTEMARYFSSEVHLGWKLTPRRKKIQKLGTNLFAALIINAK